MKKPELLAPAGNLEKLKIAIAYGADAVYMSGKSYGLRAFSGNFTDEELIQGIDFAHEKGKKAYITINIFPHNDDLSNLPEYIHLLAEGQADAIILSDPGVYRMVREIAPNMPIHISTQANTNNWSSVLFWQDLGVSRVVLAREISLEDIAVIRERVNIELEAFVHGAMCISYSGRCLLSNYLTARDANRGECSQPCRWKYAIVEEKRPGQYFPVLEDERGSYVFNSKDLCLLPRLPEIINSGLNSLKLEGRMKSIHYVATVVKVYREAIDRYIENPHNFTVQNKWLGELKKVSHRSYTTGFYFNKTDQTDQVYTSSSYTQTHDFVGLVREYDSTKQQAIIEQRNNMKIGEEIEVMQPGKPNFSQKITNMADSEGNMITVAPHPQQIISMSINQQVAPFAMLRRKVSENE